MSQVLLFSLTAMANPTLLAVTTILLILPSPKRLMIGYLIGAFLMSIPVGLVIVLAFKHSGLVHSGKTTINPVLDFTFGAVLLIIAYVVASGRDRPVRERRAARKADKPHKTPRWQKVLDRGDPRLTVVVGAVLTLPGASYLAAMDAIAKLHYGKPANIALVLLVNLIMLIPLEVPLIAFTVAPEWTPATIDRVKAWFRRDGRRVLLIGCLAVGSLVIVRGAITVLAS